MYSPWWYESTSSFGKQNLTYKTVTAYHRSSFSRENGQPLLICSSLITHQPAKQRMQPVVLAKSLRPHPPPRIFRGRRGEEMERDPHTSLFAVQKWCIPKFWDVPVFFLRIHHSFLVVWCWDTLLLRWNQSFRWVPKTRVPILETPRSRPPQKVRLSLQSSRSKCCVFFFGRDHFSMGKKNAKALTSSSSKYQKEYGTSKLDLLTKTNLASGKLVNWLGINPPGFNF